MQNRSGEALSQNLVLSAANYKTEKKVMKNDICPGFSTFHIGCHGDRRNIHRLNAWVSFSRCPIVNVPAFSWDPTREN